MKVNCDFCGKKTDYLLELMCKHIEEIEQLKAKGDKHYVVETGDLIILCFEMLLENQASIDETLETCFKRYEDKLGGAFTSRSVRFDMNGDKGSPTE